MDQDFDITTIDIDNVEKGEPDEGLFFEEKTQTLTKEEEDKMLYSIKIKVDTENLLDLSCQGPEGQASKKQSEDPRYWQFVENRVVEISDPLTISDGLFTSYKLYKLRTRKTDDTNFDTLVERRYNDFEYLHQQLIQQYGGWLIPRLPDKNIWANLDMETQKCRQERKNGLQKYISRLLLHQKIRYTEELRLFLFSKNQTFSQKKGEFSSRKNYEQVLTKITNNAYQTGISFIGSFMSKEIYQPTSNYRLPVTKQDNQIFYFEQIVAGLNETIQEICVIVENTIKQSAIIDSLGSIFDGLCDNGEFYGVITNQTEQLEEEYEEIFQFIESCKEALQRRSSLRKELENLKNQEQILLTRHKNNPRSMSLDMIRAQIQSSSKKYQQWTKELLVELGSQITEGKSKLRKFVDNLNAFRRKMYSTQK